MARARNIKPDFFTDESIVELQPITRLLFIGMWTLADREGRLEDRPKQIKLRVLPADNFDIELGLSELSSLNFIQRYSVDGKKFIQIRNFKKHQSPHVKEASSTIPAPDEHGAGTSIAPDKHHASRPDCLNLIVDSGFLIPDSIKTTAATRAQTQILEIIEMKRSEISRLFPKIDLAIATEKLLHYHRNSTALIDPYLTVIKWFQTEFTDTKKGKSSRQSEVDRILAANAQSCREFVGEV